MSDARKEIFALARRVKITIEPSSEHPGVLDIQDAMKQVADFFDLLTDFDQNKIVWNLVLATTNSPFVVEGEPFDLRTKAAAYSIAGPHLEKMERCFERVESGGSWGDEFPREKLEIARNLLKRNTNGIGTTAIQFGEGRKVIKITEEVSSHFFQEIEAPTLSLHSYLYSTTARKEYGSVEGRIISIGRNYGEPAILLSDANTGREIWCRMDAVSLENLSQDLKAGDVWEHRRVRVRGALHFDSSGKIMRVFEGRVSFLESKDVDLKALSDPEFTSGYRTVEYLDRLRDDDFGQ